MKILPMLWKELVQLRRDRFTLAMMLGVPAIQLALFGYAIQTDVRHLPTVVLDESRTSESRRLVETMRNTGNFDVIEHVESRAALADRIESGRANAGLVIPPGYMRDLKRGRTAQAQMVVDAADPLRLFGGTLRRGAGGPGARRCACGASGRAPAGARHSSQALVQPRASERRVHRARHHRRDPVQHARRRWPRAMVRTGHRSQRARWSKAPRVGGSTCPVGK